jgi:hypothetical protein
MRPHISFGFMVKMVNNCYLRQQTVPYGMFLLFETRDHTKCHKVGVKCSMVLSIADLNLRRISRTESYDSIKTSYFIEIPSDHLHLLFVDTIQGLG